MLKVYQEAGRSDKRLALRLVEQGGDLQLNAVDADTGGHVTHILQISKHGIAAHRSAKQCIQSAGYSSEFTKWGEDGRIVQLTP